MSRPDEVTATDKGGGFAPHPEGQFPMVCVDVVDLGVNVEQFGDQEPREAHKVALVFASGATHETGELILVTTEMTLSMNEKANLRKFLQAWRGKSYSEEQAKAGVPLHKLAGQAALVSIEHVTTRKGRQFAKLATIAPLPKAMPAPNGTSLSGYARPQFLEDRKAAYAAALTKHRAISGQEPEPQFPGDDDEDMSIPF